MAKPRLLGKRLHTAKEPPTSGQRTHLSARSHNFTIVFPSIPRGSPRLTRPPDRLPVERNSAQPCAKLSEIEVVVEKSVRVVALGRGVHLLVSLLAATG